jgi:uncharacterized membrane protein YeaQ/YmgE (transglycosylase-associated protein family)
MVVTRTRAGLGRFQNVLLGMAGALVGGMLFNGLGVDLGLGDLSISFVDLIAAFVGSIVVFVLVWLLKRFRRRSAA